ncbi:MAG: ATP-grasp domain-containing protein [Sulfuriferula sp.]
MSPPLNDALNDLNWLDESSANSEPIIGVARLMRLVAGGADLSNLVNISAYNPDDANLLMNLSMVFQLTGNREVAFEIQNKALERRRLYHLPAQVPAAITLLALMRPGDMMDNTPLDFLLEQADVNLDLLYVSTAHPLPADIPEHDILFIAIGESIENGPLLEQIAIRITNWPRPVINYPDKIMRLSRHCASALLSSINSVTMPTTARIDRLTLILIANGERSTADFLENDSFPIIIRPLDSHAGRGLSKLDEPANLHEYLSEMTATEFYISRFIDYSGADGQFRKYRIALVAGQAYACHMAISGQWMVHYKNAGMAESAAKRVEENDFMTHFDTGFGSRHATALQTIYERIALDYFIIDCAETADGRLLVFELDNRGFVHAMDAVELFPYKPPVMKKLFDAFRALLGCGIEWNKGI